jgi:hypothetical protein
VGVVEGKGSSIYEISSAKAVHYIDQMQKIIAETPSDDKVTIYSLL